MGIQFTHEGSSFLGGIFLLLILFKPGKEFGIVELFRIGGVSVFTQIQTFQLFLGAYPEADGGF